MKALILNPPYHTPFVREGRCEQRSSSYGYVMVPISLPYIAAVLEKDGHEVSIIDSIAEKLTEEETIKRIKKFCPAVVIVNISTPTYYSDIKISNMLKQLENSPVVAVIGNHVTALDKEVLQESNIDVVVRGEPEITCKEMVDSIKNGGNLSTVKGLTWRDNGSIVRNPDRPFFEPLDAMPFPARHLIRNKLYTMPITNEPYTLLVSGRGCPNNCIYCTAHLYYGRKPRVRSPLNVVEEIEDIYYKYNLRSITFWGDTGTINKNQITGICEEIINRGLNQDMEFFINSRVDSVDYDMLKLMRKAGFTKMSFGIESGDQEILKNIKKRITLQQSKDAVANAKKAGIEVLAHIIFGLPGETKSSINKTIKFVKELNPHFPQFYAAIPFPGTEFYDFAIKNNAVTTADWSKFEINNVIMNYPNLSKEEIYDAKVRAYKEFYFSPRYFTNAIRLLKSPKNAKRALKQAINFYNDWIKIKNEK